jgi:hypothetical protein
MSASTARQTFRETVAAVAMAAKAKLPQAVNGRIESAAKLVLWQDVEPQDDGTILVGSSSDPGKTYRLAGTSCECQDFTRGNAPEGWCQHRIAAGIHKRVGQLLAAQPAEPMEPELIESFPDNDPEEPPAVAPQPPALPEAPASVNVRVTISGREVQWTLRDSDETRLAARLEALLTRYPAQSPAVPTPEPATPVCPYHGAMKASTKRPGTFFCPKKLHDGSYCQGK